MDCPGHSDCERMLRDTPPTRQERRSMGLLIRLRPGLFDDAEALAFVRVFAWRISRSSGGVEGFLR